MSKHNANITKKLRRWLRGDANLHDERELDRHAQNDPFLAEAMEGYRRTPASDHTDSLQRIHQKLARPQAKSSAISYWRVAAAIALLLVAGTVLFQLQTDDAPAFAEKTQLPPPVQQQTEATPLAEAESMTDQEATSPVAAEATQATAPVQAKEREIVSQQNVERVAEEQAVPPPTDPVQVAREERHLEQEEAIANQADADQTTKEAASPANSTAPPSAPPAMDYINTTEDSGQTRPSPLRSTDLGEQKKSNIFSNNPKDRLVQRSEPVAGFNSSQNIPGKRIVYGKILDVMGEPIIGASVTMNNLKLSTNTNAQGEFELWVDSTAHELQIDYVGYNSLVIDVPAGGNISERFTLDDESLSVNQVQIAVTGLSQTRTKRLEPMAYPEGGRAAFKQHVKENAARGLPKGRVRLRFKIGADGRPYNIRVERSNNAVLNSSAMYLLQTGPDWNIVQGIPPIDMQYTVRFR